MIAYLGFQIFSPCLSKKSLRASRTISLLLPYRPFSIMRSIPFRYSLLSLIVRDSCIFSGGMIFHALEYVFQKIRLCMMRAIYINARARQRLWCQRKYAKLASLTSEGSCGCQI